MNTMNINIIEAMLVLIQLHAWTCTKSSHSNIQRGYHIIILHHNHFNAMLISKINHYQLPATYAWHEKLSSLIVIANMFNHNGLNRLNIFTQTEQVEFIQVSLCHGQFIECRHYCLSIAWPNDMKIIIVQECHGLGWNLQTFYSTGEGKVKCALY